jgi:hypothetical protein
VLRYSDIPESNGQSFFDACGGRYSRERYRDDKTYRELVDGLINEAKPKKN